VPLVKKAPTIQDVAAFAEVSTATVSRALSRPDRVSEATLLRVSKAVAATGYTINQSARSLRQKTARTILVALPDIGNTFFASILDAIEREAANRGYGVLIANRLSGADPGHRLREFFQSNRTDGLLLLDGSVTLEHLTMLADTPVPVVVACEEIPDSPFPLVITDNRYASEMATRHLIALGHQRIGHLRGPRGNILRGVREDGFRKAMAEAGLRVREDWLVEASFTMDSGLAAARTFLSLPERPTAIFAANDESAIGFLSGLRQEGVECPRDLSLVGFDDLAVAAHFVPPLTTMRQPSAAVGRLAAEALIDMIEGEPRSRVPRQMVLSSNLIVRGSTARPTQRATSVFPLPENALNDPYPARVP
jgi:LacI family repressor for deo operon, udp, cdd, tsx, nupC, and nupG